MRDSVIQRLKTVFWLLLTALAIASLAPSEAQPLEVTPAAEPAPAASTPNPWASRRIVGRFDFEETDDAGVPLGLTQPMPRGWYAIGRAPDTAEPGFLQQPLHAQLIGEPGFPRRATVAYDDTHTATGRFSLLLAHDGGHAGAFLQVGSVAAIPGSAYLVEAMVRTEALTRATAQLTAYFIDDAGRLIDETVAASEPIRTHGRWQRVVVHLKPMPRRVAWIGLRVELRQADADPDDPLGAHQLVLTDVHGQAWFDDIRVWQQPSITLRTASPTNVLNGAQPPQLTLAVRDLTGQRLTADTRVFDVDGRVIDTHRQTVGGGAPSRWTWRPALTGFGWYRVELIIREQDTGAAVQREASAFVWMPDASVAARADLERFVLQSESLPADVAALLPGVLDALSLRAVTLSAWAPDTRASTMDERVRALDAVVQPLLANQRRVDLSLWPLPDELLMQQATGRVDVLPMLAGPSEAWIDYLAPVFRQFGQRVHRWQLGPMPTSASLAAPPEAADAAAVISTFNALTPMPRLTLPQRLDTAAPVGGPDEPWVDLLAAPPAVRPDALADYLQGWPLERTGVHLTPLPPDRSTHRQRVNDLLLRMLHAWEAGVAEVSVPPLWQALPRDETTLVPDPLLAAYANAAHRLAGRRVVGELSLTPGVRCLILDGEAGGMLAVWNASAPADTTVTLHLGEAVTLTDAFGNTTDLPADDAGRQSIAVPRTPVFIQGIDTQLALFRAGFSLDPPLVIATQERHDHNLTIVNPWPYTISGTMTISGPPDWTIRPSRHAFSIAAGESTDIPLQLTMPVAELAGDKQLQASFDFQAGRQYTVDLAAPMRLGLPDVRVNASLSLPNGDTGTDAVVTLTITNTGDEPGAYYAFASLYGSPRQEQYLPIIEPGETVVRRFRFTGGGSTLDTHAIRTGIRESRGPAKLNLRLTLGDAQ